MFSRLVFQGDGCSRGGGGVPGDGSCHVSMSGYCSVYRSNSIFRSDPYFSLASLSNVKCSVMLWSDNRNIMDYWMFVARYCFKYDF